MWNKTKLIRITCLIILISQITLNSYSQNSISHKGEEINLVESNGLKQGIWKIYSSNEDRAPNGKVYFECTFIDNKIQGDYLIRKGKNTLIKISPTTNNNASFVVTKGSKEFTGTISRTKGKTIYLNSSGNSFNKDTNDWLKRHTQFMPMHYGGVTEIQRQIKHLSNPANTKNEKGRVYIGFVVDTNGYIINTKISKIRNTTPDINGLLGKEALRIVNLLPRMQPAFQGCRFVKTKYTIPINF